MIKNLQISGVHSQVTPKVKTYATKKIGSLDKYIPKKARESTFVDIKLKDKKIRNKLAFECEVIMKLPKATITAHEESITVLASIDEVVDNLKNQLKKYKEMHAEPRVRRGFLARYKKPLPADNLF